MYLGGAGHHFFVPFENRPDGLSKIVMKVCTFAIPRPWHEKSSKQWFNYLQLHALIIARKYKSTGCARIFIVLLIVAPIAFFVASYINGSDPIETIRSAFDSDPTSTTKVIDDDTSVSELRAQIERLEKDVNYYKVESETYKKLLDECQAAKAQ